MSDQCSVTVKETVLIAPIFDALLCACISDWIETLKTRVANFDYFAFKSYPPNWPEEEYEFTLEYVVYSISFVLKILIIFLPSN